MLGMRSQFSSTLQHTDLSSEHLEVTVTMLLSSSSRPSARPLSKWPSAGSFHGCTSERPNKTYATPVTSSMAAVMQNTIRHCSTLCCNPLENRMSLVGSPSPSVGAGNTVTHPHQGRGPGRPDLRSGR